MKKLTLALCALTALASAAYAGTESYSGKESKQMAPACPQWFADSEWNIGISGIYAPYTDRGDDFGSDGDFGGAIDVKYFFHKYFGIGVQGFGLALDNNNRFGNNNDDWAGAALGTFTFRYPIPCSRFAPYAWAGAGAIWNNNDNRFNARRFVNNNNDDDARFIGQGGVGFEVRITPHFGWTNDVSYNYVDGSHNDFFQLRTGLNFAF